MSFFDDSHVTDVGLEGSAGPSVGAWDQIKQNFEEQFRARSSLSLEQEVQNRWLENLGELQRLTGEAYNMPKASPLEEESLGDLRAYMDYVETGENNFSSATSFETPEARLQAFQRADDRIAQLNNPSVKSFKDIIQEVYDMQADVIQQTAKVNERGSFLPALLGSAAGSFTTRDPLNIYTLPIGGEGRGIAMHIASEAVVGGAASGITTGLYVNPNLRRAGIEEQSLAGDIIAGAAGGAILRGLFEGAGKGFRSLPAVQRRAALRELENMQFDARDTALRAMLETMPQSPRARAGVALLDDAQAMEAANPYGDGPTAEARFYAELRETAAAISGKPMTAVGQLLPPMPFESIERAVDFRLVKEQSPDVWKELQEAGTAAVRAAENTLRVYHGTTKTFDEFSVDKALFEKAVWFTTDSGIASDYASLGGWDNAQVRFNDVDTSEFLIKDMEGAKYNALNTAAAMEEATAGGYKGIVFQNFEDGIKRGSSVSNVVAVIDTAVIRKPFDRVTANKRYAAAYRAVEAEAEKLNRAQAIITGQAQREAVDLLGFPTAQKPFVGPLMRHDIVEARVAEINKANEQVTDRADQIAAAEIDPETGLVDIGLSSPVPKDFVVPFDDGNMTIEQVMDEFRDDDLLDEAMRTCLI